MLELLRFMLKEEFRMHTSYTTKRMFLMFPVMVTLFSLAIALTSERIFLDTPLAQVLLVLHLSVFLYGLSVGAFGFLGRQYQERATGYRNYIVTTPATLPMSFRQTFLGMYLRDAIFYILLLLAPMALGVALSVPWTHFRLTSVALLFLATLLTFLLGMSLSFAISTLYVRSVPAFAAAVAAVSGLFAAAGLLDVVPLESLLPGLGLQYAVPPYAASVPAALGYAGLATLLVLALTAAAVLFVEDRYESKTSRSADTLPTVEARLPLFRSSRVLLAKELVDLKRSGTPVKMLFSFVLPLIFLAFTAWFVRNGLAVPVGFNTVFYGGMVGFFGVSLYNWLNNVDGVDYLASLPLTVPQVIKVKLRAFLILTTWISTLFVVAISWLNQDTRLLWLALPVMFVVSVYMVVVTAYLTGLRTNSFFFNFGIMAKFSVMSMLPDICLTILSFTVDRDLVFSVAGIAVVLVALGVTTWILYRGLEARWGRAEFGE
ncbi:MAG TPA: hypothetical protein VJ397_06015 [Thermoplasmata archaeon]|nr:hypothetical protein [Thermoplasmata archaeon]